MNNINLTRTQVYKFVGVYFNTTPGQLPTSVEPAE